MVDDYILDTWKAYPFLLKNRPKVKTSKNEVSNENEVWTSSLN